MRKYMLLEWATLMLTALVMGILWGTWFTLSRSIAQIEPTVFLGIGQTSIANLAVPMSILMPATIISTVILLAVAVRLHRKQSWLVGAALLCMLGVIIVTLSISVPIDNQIKTWTVQSLPADWTALRDRWELVHTIRTFLSVIAVAALAGYLVTTRKSEESQKG